MLILKLRWMEACGLAVNDYTTERKVCSQHFTDDCFILTKTKKYLHADAVPSIFDTGNPSANVSTVKKDYTTERSQNFIDNYFNAVKKNTSYSCSDSVPVISNTDNLNANVSSMRKENLNPGLSHAMKTMNKPNQQLVTTETEKVPNSIIKPNTPEHQNYPAKWFCHLCSTFFFNENVAKLHLDTCSQTQNVDSTNAQEPVDEH